MTDDPNRTRPLDTNTHRDAEGRALKNPTEARQAAPAGRVRWVLIIGIAAVAVAFLLAYLGTRP